MLRKLLVSFALTSFCLTGALVAAETPSKVKAKPSPARVKPGKLDKGDVSVPPGLSCQYLVVYFTGGNVAVPNVSCDHGYFDYCLGQPGNQTCIVHQSSVYGPDCTFTLSTGGTVKAQQNYCAAEAGNITASVVQAGTPPVVLTSVQTGSYAQSIPGQAWFTVQ
jgi:hypothetical protein